MSWRLLWAGLLVLSVAALTACSRGVPAPIEFRSAAPSAPAKAPARKTAKPAANLAPAPVGAVAVANPVPVTARIEPGDYEVAAGDSLIAISQRSGVALRDLIDSNALDPPYHLIAGQRLDIPAVRYHTVAPGETVTSIASRYGVSTRALVSANAIEDPFVIRSGERLRLPAAMEETREPVRVAVPAPATTAAARVPPPEVKAASPAARSGLAPVPAARPLGRGHMPPLPGQKPGTRLVSAEPSPAAIPRPPRRAGRRFAWPVQGNVISGFGPKAGGFYNDGINIAVRPGTPVRAAENGVVTYVGNELRGFGNLLLLRHEGGWVTAYAHAERIGVKPGDIVRRGQVIARAGRSGRVSHPQLHFEIRKGRQAVNPLRHLPKPRVSGKVAAVYAAQ